MELYMHMWGDEWFEKNDNDLYNAISYIMKTWTKYGRIGTHGKEKYGTFRDHPYFWDGGIHYLLYPGYVRVVHRWLYFYVDWYFTQPFMRYTGLLHIGLWWQAQVYNYAIQMACKKYPHIVDEIVSHLEGYMLVKPGIFGPIDGTKIHNKYWKSL